MMNTILQKLKYKESYASLTVNTPRNISLKITNNDSNIEKQHYDFILIFVTTKSETDVLINHILEVSDADSLVWIAYPKKASKIESDLSRDEGWDSIVSAGYRPVSQVSIDSDWSALRFKPSKDVQPATTSKTQTFEATILGSEERGGAWVKIPFDTQVVYGKTGQIKVKVNFDGRPYQGSIANMGDGPILIVRKDIRRAINKEVGDKVLVELQEDKTIREINIPEELMRLLNENKAASEFYYSLSYTNRKEYAQWIESAKRPATKQMRLDETLSRLKDRIKNPFIKLD